MNGFYKEENVSQPDNTINTLLKLLNTAKQSGIDLPSGYRTPNALLNPRPVTPDFRAEVAPTPVAPVAESVGTSALQPAIPILPDATQVTPPTSQNAVLDAISRTPAPPTAKPTNALLDYWGQPVVGKMPLDKFVQIAGALSHAIAPQEPIGRAGGVLSQIGGAAYAERVKEPENVLRRRLLEAQAKRLEEPKTPTQWQAIWDSLEGKIDPETNKPYTAGGKIKYFEKLKAIPKEPKYNIDVQKNSNTGEWEHGRRDESTGVFTADRLATAAEIESKVTGKSLEPKVPTLKEEFKNINGVPHKRQIEWDSAKKQWVSKGDWIRMEKPEKPEKPEKLSIGDAHTIYNTRMSGIKTRIMLDMTPDEKATVADQTPKNFMELYMADRIGRSIPPEKREKYRKEIIDAETEFNELSGGVLGRKGITVSPKITGAVGPETATPNLLTDIEYKGPVATGKIVPGPSPKVLPPEKKKPEAEKGKTFSVQDVVKAGGKTVQMKDGSIHVFDKDGNYVGTAIREAK